tara:strand:- start:117 stop:386 length:270 start_codon:yes stop_codon:yes gene_type:complete
MKIIAAVYKNIQSCFSRRNRKISMLLYVSVYTNSFVERKCTLLHEHVIRGQIILAREIYILLQNKVIVKAHRCERKVQRHGPENIEQPS